MAKEGRTSGEQRENEDDLLDFDLDDISSESLEQEIFGDEIIELKDLVQRGADEDQTRDTGVAGFSRESESAEIKRSIDLSTNEIAKVVEMAPEEMADETREEFDLSDMSLELDLEAVGESDPVGGREQEEITSTELDRLLKEEPPEEEAVDLIEREPQLEAKISDEDLSADDLESFLEDLSTREVEMNLEGEAEEKSREMPGGVEEAEDVILEETLEELATTELEHEEPLDLEAEPEDLIETDGLEESSPSLEAEPDREEVSLEIAEEEELPDILAETAVPESVGISEERLESMITKVVEDVAERVIRQTVAEVAEKVLGEAIDALKKSLESTSD